jgi:hypothetical protein
LLKRERSPEIRDSAIHKVMEVIVMCNGVGGAGGSAGAAGNAGSAGRSLPAAKKQGAALDRSTTPPDKNSELLAALAKLLQSAKK